MFHPAWSFHGGMRSRRGDQSGLGQPLCCIGPTKDQLACPTQQSHQARVGGIPPDWVGWDLLGDLKRCKFHRCSWVVVNETEFHLLGTLLWSPWSKKLFHPNVLLVVPLPRHFPLRWWQRLPCDQLLPHQQAQTGDGKGQGLHARGGLSIPKRQEPPGEPTRVASGL